MPYTSVTSSLSSRHRGNEKNKPGLFAKAICTGRACIQQAVGNVKRFKRVALRCEKTKRNFAPIVALATGFILVKSVHTTQLLRFPPQRLKPAAGGTGRCKMAQQKINDLS